MTRFFISIDQSLDFVLNSLRLSEGGSFYSKMKSIKIVDLAKIIDNSTKLKIGVRPGEKIHENYFLQTRVIKFMNWVIFFFSDTILSFKSKIKNLPKLLKQKKPSL